MYFLNKNLFSCYLNNFIDNLIYDPTKHIWINLELYFEIYEFSNFSGIFLEFL